MLFEQLEWASPKVQEGVATKLVPIVVTMVSTGVV